jgi:hypothetical protein
VSYDKPWADSLEKEQGPIEKLAPNLWWVWSVMASPPMPRNMIIARLASGGLLLHSPVCLSEGAMAELDALGPVEVVLIPNAGHRMDAKRYRARYPDAVFVCPANARAEVEQVVPIDSSCEDVLPDKGVRIHRPGGVKDGYELVYELDLEGGGVGLLVNDLLAQPHPHQPGGIKGFLMGLLGPKGGKLGQPRIVRFFFGKDRAAFRQFVEELAAIDDLRLMTMSHAAPIRNPVQALKDAATRL